MRYSVYRGNSVQTRLRRFPTSICTTNFLTTHRIRISKFRGLILLCSYTKHRPQVHQHSKHCCNSPKAEAVVTIMVLYIRVRRSFCESKKAITVTASCLFSHKLRNCLLPQKHIISILCTCSLNPYYWLFIEFSTIEVQRITLTILTEVNSPFYSQLNSLYFY